VPSDHEVFDHFPDVWIDRDNIAHYRGLMAGKLLINRCSDCGWWIYPHRPMCPKCLSWRIEATPVSGKGRLYMYTLLYQSRDPDKPLLEPMQTAAIELDEQPGLRYLSRVINCPELALAHDMPVVLTWLEEGGRKWPAFEPAPASAPHPDAAHG
jgi:uncharacterized OB-fold protein